MAKVYVAGSLQNPMVLDTAIDLRASGHEVFVDWFGGGPKADEHWRDTQIALGHNMREAIEGSYAQNILAYDERWMEWAECVVVVEPAGKSGHMELVLGEAVLRSARESRWVEIGDRN